MEREILVNGAFGNRCNLCGHFFDEDGVCVNRHKQDAVYEKKGEEIIKLEGEEAENFLLNLEAEKKAERESSHKKSIRDNCPFCGTYLDDDDIACSRGHIRLF